MQTTRNPHIPADSHRLSILTQHEIDELYGLPRFTNEDRQTCFDLSESERHAVHSRTTSVAVHLTLQLGYFKAKRQLPALPDTQLRSLSDDGIVREFDGVRSGLSGAWRPMLTNINFLVLPLARRVGRRFVATNLMTFFPIPPA